jgi:hypothetical protein
MSRLPKPLLICMLALSCSPLAFSLPAQTPGQSMDGMHERTLSGTITDPHHEPLRGAIVELQEGESANIISYVTDQDGRYHFLRLKGNQDYSVWAKFRNRESKHRSISKFADKPEQVVDFELETF